MLRSNCFLFRVGLLFFAVSLEGLEMLFAFDEFIDEVRGVEKVELEVIDYGLPFDSAVLVHAGIPDEEFIEDFGVYFGCGRHFIT